MSENELDIVLQYIFKFLHPKDLSTCRLVCSFWQRNIDRLKYTQTLWRQHCKRDYPDIFLSAYMKSQFCFSWYHLYRSLTLWNKLSSARDTIHELAFASNSYEEILGFQLLRNGIIGVHSITKITYYYLHTFDLARRNGFIGHYCKYRENDFIISCLNYNKQLTVVMKNHWHSTDGATYLMPDVKLFSIIEDTIYYVTYVDKLYTFKGVEGRPTTTVADHVPDGVISLGHQNGYLYVLTRVLCIFLLDNNHLKYIRLDGGTAKLFDLITYNFLEQLDWRMYYHWYCFLEKLTPIFSVSQIATMHSHGRILITGYDWGVLHIFDSPNRTQELLNIIQKPTKVYNVMQHSKLAISPILQIDVVEGKDRHQVVIALPQQIVVIDIQHNDEDTEEEIFEMLNQIVP